MPGSRAAGTVKQERKTVNWRIVGVIVLLLAAAAAVAGVVWWVLASPEQVAEAPSSPPQLAEIPVEQWHSVTQPAELGAWAMYGEQECKEVAESSEWTMRRFGFEKDSFKDKVLVDIGCGPVGRLTWLEGEFIAIEPLAKQFRLLPFARLEKYGKIYEEPAEERIEELIGAVDQIVAINSLDHAFNLNLILENMFLYLKPGGEALISVDVNIEDDQPDPYHPLRLRHPAMRELLKRHGFEILREEHGKCTPKEDGWGAGVAYHWWLRKPG